VDPTKLVPLSALASQLTTATSETMQKVGMTNSLTNVAPILRLPSITMQLKIHSDASYFSEPKAKSRVYGYYFLENNINNKAPPLTNGTLLCISTALKHGVSSIEES
jgi:hypothetical protein